MSSTTEVFACLALLVLAGCATDRPRLQIAQSRAIDTDIDATHVVGPTSTSPARTQSDVPPTLAPWRNEEVTDHLRALREQLAQ